ncbi:MAG: hypothetical protein QM784_22730 [Polyangiaceae bacterium]
MASAQSEMSSAESTHGEAVTDAERTSTEQIAEAEAQNAEEQATARNQAKGDVAKQRGDWTGAQQDEIRGADEEASRTVSEAAKNVSSKRTEANDKATKEVEDGNTEARKAKKEGQTKAEQERARGKEQSDGFFGWVASKAKAFFDSIKAGIQKALDAARAAVKKAIEAAKKAATDLIESARKWIVDKIKAAGDFLIALGDRVLAAFPGLREKFRNAIKALVSAAEKVVNALAEGLKKAVQMYLDAWGALLDAALGALAFALKAAVDAVASVVNGAISAAKGIADTFGVFAALIKDIAPNPSGWLSNLGASVVDGIKNHLWKAFKAAVKEWFNAKLEAVIGVGKVIWQIVTGQLGFPAIAKMAWEAILAMLPPVLIRLLIEKLVAVIVPAAGALLAIVEGLQAAWGTISSIIAAIDKFITFLKAVKGGGAGAQFAAALASAAIVVLDFVANFLIAKLASGLKKLAGKLGGIAKRLTKRRKAAGGRSARKARRNKRKGERGPKRKRRGASKPRRRPSRSRPRRGPGRPRGRNRGKPRRKPEDRRERDRKEKLARLNRAKTELPPKIDALLTRGVNGLFLRGRLLVWRLQYRLSALSISGSGKSFDIIAKVNPTASVGHGIKMDCDELLTYLRDLADELITKRDDVKSQAAAMLATHGTTKTSTDRIIPQVTVPSGTSIPAQVLAGEQLPPLRRGQNREVAFKDAAGSTIGATRQVQSRHEGRQHQLIKEATENGLTAKTYVEIARDAGTNGPRLAQALISFQNGVVPEGHSATQLAALHQLMFGQETMRSRAAMVQAQMSLELLGSGKSPEQIFGKNAEKGGLFPMSGEGAQSRALAADQSLGRAEVAGRPSPTNVSKRALERQLRREVALVRAWIKTLDIEFKAGASQREKIETLKQEIRRRLLASFNLPDSMAKG